MTLSSKTALNTAFFFIILALAMPSALAYNISYYSADYDIIDSTTIVTISLEFKQPVSDFAWIIPDDATSISSNLTLNVRNRGENKEISTNETIREITFSYVTDAHVEHNKDKYFLLDFSNIQYDRASIIVRLPPDAHLKYSIESQKSSIIPKTTNVLTDGQRIIIRWTEVHFRTSKALLVIYDSQDKMGWIGYFAIAAVIFIIAWLALFYNKGLLEKKPSEMSKTPLISMPVANDEELLTRNLFEEEKQIVQELLKEKSKEMWQKTLQLRTGLDKVRLSRKLRSLEAKGIIERIAYGNTKKIRLVMQKQK